MNFEDIYNKEENKEWRKALHRKSYELYEIFDMFCKSNDIDVRTFECHYFANENKDLGVIHTIEKVNTITV